MRRYFRTFGQQLIGYCWLLLVVVLTFQAVISAAGAAHLEADGLHVRVGAYNVSFLSEASAAEIGQMLNGFDLDIVGLTEVPRAPASAALAAAIGVDHFVVGTISSGQSADKLKALVSRSPLSAMSEIDLSASQGGFVGGGGSAAPRGCRGDLWGFPHRG